MYDVMVEGGPGGQVLHGSCPWHTAGHGTAAQWTAPATGAKWQCHAGPLGPLLWAWYTGLDGEVEGSWCSCLPAMDSGAVAATGMSSGEMGWNGLP